MLCLNTNLVLEVKEPLSNHPSENKIPALRAYDIGVK
jgi:hypothetical protein